MATINIKNLGIGSLTTVPTGLYTVPASTSALIKTISLVNSLPVSVNVNLALSSGTSSAFILPPTYSMDGLAMLLSDSNITIPPNASISGWASSGGVVQYVISGVEST
jgi:hypothetical protein